MPTYPDLNGFILINKTIGHSSNHIVQKTKQLFGAQKVGHTGTLDPFADGLMIITLGHGTKISQFLLDAHKSYRAVLQFGTQTDSGDLTGNVIATHDGKMPCSSYLMEIISNFLGAQLQIPPMFSALKSNGKPLYEYAQQGISIERQARPIDILKISLIDLNPSLKQATLDIECSKGTYIRTLAEDIAKSCGSLAHLIKLTRTSQFILTKDNRKTLDMSDARSLDELGQMQEIDRLAHIQPVQCLLGHLATIVLSDNQFERWLYGQRLRLVNQDSADTSVGSEQSATHIMELETDPMRCVYYKDRLIGIGKYLHGVLHPERLMVDPAKELKQLSI